MQPENTKNSFESQLKMICDWRKDLIEQNQDLQDGFNTERNKVRDLFESNDWTINYAISLLGDDEYIKYVNNGIDKRINDLRNDYKRKTKEADQLLEHFITNSRVLQNVEISTKIVDVREQIDDITGTISMSNQVKILESLNHLHSIIARFQWLTLQFVKDSKSILTQLNNNLDTQVKIINDIEFLT